jgi:hypothetical protein
MSNHTVMGIRERKANSIAERKYLGVGDMRCRGVGHSDAAKDWQGQLARCNDRLSGCQSAKPEWQNFVFQEFLSRFCRTCCLSEYEAIKEAINTVKLKHIFISILAVLFVFPLMGTFAQQAPNSFSIEVITTFDYPGTGNQTLPQKINERADIVGIFLDSTLVSRGFVRFKNGSFSAPIVDPNDTVGFTEGRGINNSGTVDGDYLDNAGILHSFFLSGGTFAEYDVPGAVNTNLLSINDPGDFTGGFDDGSGIFQGFVGSGGTITSFSVPAAISTFAYEINNSKQLVVGYYIDSSGILHGYYRDANGALHFPIDPSGSVGTVLFGVNNKNWVVGRYADSSGVTHGLFFVPPNTFITFDYPGSAFTSLNGISSQGNICGRYIDASGIAHGFIARAKGAPPANEAGTEMQAHSSPSLVSPLNASPSAWGGAMPAR